MTCFRLPKTICEEIEKECANFWWGVEGGKRKMHWRSWDFLSKPKIRGGMGFRKMVEFNRALLAKQIWRLLRQPESLACRVLKARYFKHGNIMDAGLGSNPSYIWRSLHWSKEILAKGLLWRVGDGKSIKIFEHNWIPSMSSKIGEPSNPWNKNTTVSELIENGVWKENLIRDRFNTYVAGEIVKIPLSEHHSADSQFWRYDAKGRYSVRDGYRLQCGLFDPPQNQSVDTIQSWWSFLWSLSLPPKVRIFWWNVSHDAIPAKQNLFHHHVPVNDACPLCLSHCDTTCHSLFHCKVTKHLWKPMPYYRDIKEFNGALTLDFIYWMKKKLSTKDFEGFAIHTWAVWKERQKYIHGDGTKAMVDNVEWSSIFLKEYQKARQMEREPVMNREDKTEKTWQPPPISKLKMNVDACINSNLNRYGIGGVLRDKQGRLLLAFGKQINQPISVVHGELLAIREGMSLLLEKDFFDIQVTTDSLLAVQAVTTTKEDLGYVGSIATDVLNRLQDPIFSDFQHVFRSANLVAHKIALFASSSPSPFVWMNGEFPSWLVKLVIDDLHQ